MQLHRPHLRRALTWLRAHVPGRTVRARLTLLYGSLFLASGTVLLVIVALLWGNATGGTFLLSSTVPSHIFHIAGIGPPPGAVVARGGNYVSPVVVPAGAQAVVTKQHQVFGQLHSLAVQQHAHDVHQLLLYSAVALAIMAMLAIGAGWLTAGRVLRPLRTITVAARDISASNLHARLDLQGPEDEMKEVGDTIDDLLERLEGSFRSQRQFVANASHELRTPLATMRASIDVALAKREPVPQQTVVLANRLRHELDQIDRLLGSFLDLARSEAPPVDSTSVASLDLLVATALERQTAEIAARGVRVDEDDCPAACVAGNVTLLSRMVDNLVENAVRHNERSGWIRVRTEVDGAAARLVVENGGPRLDDVALQELMQPFRRLGPERTGSGAGFGLGLSIVASIAASHGGTVELRPLPGGGLRAAVSLPLAAPVPVAAGSVP
ncbi:MAG: sensor histidine kinase [Acidimicrobiales bacterium]